MTTPVPYVSQKGNTPRNDCGAACVLMLARWVGKAADVSVATLSAQIDVKDDGTTSNDLASALKSLGLTPVYGTSGGYPAMALVKYSKLPLDNRSDKTGDFLHWIVRLSDTTYHDPYHLGAGGSNLTATKAVLDAAEAAALGSLYRVGIVERPSDKARITGAPAGTKVRVKATSSYVRPQATTNPTVTPPYIGTVLKGSEATVRKIVAGEGGDWYSWPMSIGGMPIFEVDDKTPRECFIRADQFEPIIATPPPTTPSTPTAAVDARYILGIHELGGKGKASEALAMNAKAVGVFNNAVGAMQLADKYTDAIVWHRIYHTAAISADELLAQHGINVNETSRSRAFYRGRNESDVPGYGSTVDGIKRRAEFDVEMATKLRRSAPNATYIAGGFAHGNPDFTNKDICDAIKTYYAPHYNSGLFWFDIHNYDKSAPGNPKDFKYYAPIWFPCRWQFLFTHCGFDPRIKAVCSTEDGVEAGAGGMRWAGFTSAEFRAWAAYRLKVVTQRLTMPDGKQYDSQYRFGTGFQWGDENNGSGGWWGYGLSPYIPELQAAYRGEIVAERALEPVNLLEGALAPVGYHPPAKAFAF